jgi:hypothetical protein
MRLSIVCVRALYASILVSLAGIVFAQTPYLQAVSMAAINNHDTPSIGGLLVLEALPEAFKNAESNTTSILKQHPEKQRPTSRNEAAVMEHEEAEFPYPLTCHPLAKEPTAFPEKSYTIAMAYHVGMLVSTKSSSRISCVPLTIGAY